MFYHLLESSRRDDYNKWSNIGFTEEKKQVLQIEIVFYFIFEISNEASASVCLGVATALGEALKS